MNSKTAATERLQYLCTTIPDKLNRITSASFIHKPNPDKWSKIEILGHLIDSAANNHQRFVRLQFEHEPVIYYEQNEWVKFNYYAQQEPAVLIALWMQYNIFIARLIAKIPEEKMHAVCLLRHGESVQLSFLISDYIRHLEYHLEQILAS